MSTDAERLKRADEAFARWWYEPGRHAHCWTDEGIAAALEASGYPADLAEAREALRAFVEAEQVHRYPAVACKLCAARDAARAVLSRLEETR
jgi:hypothetical protein